MASDVEICNRALQKLGSARITSLSDDSPEANAVNACFEILRDAEYRKHPWNFAIKRAQLAADTTDPLFGPAAQYPLPSDFIRLLPSNDSDLDWRIENGAIVTDWGAPLEIRYIYKVTDPNKMDILFRESLSTMIALELCEKLTQSNTKKEGLRVDYKQIISDAKKTNAIENIAQDPPDDSWVTERA